MKTKSKKSGGMKFDGDKVPLQLIPGNALLEVGKVLRYGAQKYSEYGVCDCVLSVKKKKRSKHAGFAKTVMINGSKKLAPHIDKSSSTARPRGLNEITSTCLNTIKAALGTSQQNGTKLHEKKLTASSTQDAYYAIKQLESALTTITLPEESAAGSVSPVMLELAGSKSLNGSHEHLPTCSTNKIVRTGMHNWRSGIDYSRLIGACYRHLTAFNEGEDLDPETKLSHVAHLACEALFLLEFLTKDRPDLDDRYKAPAPKEGKGK